MGPPTPSNKRSGASSPEEQAGGRRQGRRLQGERATHAHPHADARPPMAKCFRKPSVEVMMGSVMS